jgi:hypothetical protein
VFGLAIFNKLCESASVRNLVVNDLSINVGLLADRLSKLKDPTATRFAFRMFINLMASETAKQELMQNTQQIVRWVLDFLKEPIVNSDLHSFEEIKEIDNRVEALFLLPYFMINIKQLEFLRDVRLEKVLVNELTLQSRFESGPVHKFAALRALIVLHIAVLLVANQDSRIVGELHKPEGIQILTDLIKISLQGEQVMLDERIDWITITTIFKLLFVLCFSE